MSDKTLEETLVDLARQAIVKMFKEGTFILPDYAARIKIPQALVDRVYGLIDYDEVLDLLRPKINGIVADRIAAHISQELGHDVKRTLGNEEMRNRLRLAVTQALSPEHVDSPTRSATVADEGDPLGPWRQQT
jgi:hypothetical protein